MFASNDSGCLLIWTSSDVVVNWFEIQVIRLSIDLRFKWFGCQSIWDSNEFVVNWLWDSSDLDVKWFEVQVIWLSTDVWFKGFCQTKLFCETSFKNEALKLKTKHFRETSFKNQALKIKKEAILRDFLLKRSFEAQKRSISARLPSKIKLWRSKRKHNSARLPSKTKLWSSKTKRFCEISFKNKALKIKKEAQFCETSFKNEALKIKNEAFLRDFLQNWHVEQDLTSEFQYFLVIFKWMLQKYCACHEKVEPRHTKSCNCHAKWSLQSNTSATWNLQPFHGFSVECFKHRHHKPQNPCACHAKRIVSDPLQIHHACQHFCDPHELLRLPRILQRVEIPAPATRNTLSTSKNVPSPWCFNDFDFQIALARRRGANFVEINFQKCSDTASF